MQIRRFEAPDITQALRKVKEALGPEALILSSRKTNPADCRFERSAVEVVAVVDPRADFTPAAGTVQFSPWRLGGEKRKEGGPADENALYQRVLATGLHEEFVEGLKKEAQARRREFGRNLSEGFRNLLINRLMEAVEVFEAPREGGKIWAFIGPTGGGKTTTLAKLAAYYRLRMGKKITLVTADTYRIGAADQLRTYARILRVPMEVASTREELGTILEKHRHQDLLLVDTAGRSPRNQPRVEELKDLLSVHPRVENHLVLSATTKDRDLAQAVQAFGILPIGSYLFTKVDETEEYGPLFNQLLRHKRPVSYLTNGQRVPEDIEPATKTGIARLFLKQIQWH